MNNALGLVSTYVICMIAFNLNHSFISSSLYCVFFSRFIISSMVKVRVLTFSIKRQNDSDNSFISANLSSLSSYCWPGAVAVALNILVLSARTEKSQRSKRSYRALPELHQRQVEIVLPG